MKATIFYSWESDLPGNTNRNFLQSVIEAGIRLVNKGDFEIEASLDRDTQGTPGSPNITQTIMEKIKKCDIFVADVSIVTGNKKLQQRLSPNPNVLIELGYAIGCLGWDKIILFSNEIYGQDNDLPFDIRQHRRFKYSLEVDADKSILRGQLAKGIAEAIVEILKYSSRFEEINLPKLEPIWCTISEDTGRISENSELSLKWNLKPENYEEIISKEITVLNSIDGTNDPDWKNKIKKYNEDAEKFLFQIKKRKLFENFVISKNPRSAVDLSLSVRNTGTLPATDIRCNIEIPEWLIVFEHFPKADEIPILPVAPRPSAGHSRHLTEWTSSPFFSVPSSIHEDQSSKIRLPSLHPRTNGCLFKDQSLSFWCDRLLHKHSVIPIECSVKMMLGPCIKTPDKLVTAKVFCVEKPDWENFPLKINVI